MKRGMVTPQSVSHPKVCHTPKCVTPKSVSHPKVCHPPGYGHVMLPATRAANAALKEARRRNVVAEWWLGTNNVENGRRNGGLSESTVRNIIKRWGHLPPDQGQLLDALRSGRPTEYPARCP